MNPFPELVVTGIGLVAPTGTSKQAFFAALSDAATASERATGTATPPSGQLLRSLDISDPRLKIARYMDPVSRNAIVSVGAAMSDACIKEGSIAEAPHKYGIVFGATRGAWATRQGLYESLASRRGKSVSGTLFSHCGYNIAAAMTAVAYGLKGPNLTVAAQGNLGLTVLRRARQMLATGRAHTVFAGFTECGPALNHESVPFSEWAYVLCLERKERAAGRHAVILAEVSLQDAEEEEDVVDHGHEGVRAWQRRETALTENADAFSTALPGLPEAGDRYDSLIRIGLLSHNTELKNRFPAVAFSAGRGRHRARVVLLYPREESFAA